MGLTHDSQGVSDSTYRIQYDAQAIQYIAIDGVINLSTASLTVASMIYVTASFDMQLALVALVFSPLLAIASGLYGPRLRASWHVAQQLDSKALSTIHEALGAVRVVKAFGQEEREGEKFRDRSSESIRAKLRLAILEGSFVGILGLITTCGTAAVLFIGVSHVQDGSLTIGGLPPVPIICETTSLVRLV